MSTIWFWHRCVLVSTLIYCGSAEQILSKCANNNAFRICSFLYSDAGGRFDTYTAKSRSSSLLSNSLNSALARIVDFSKNIMINM